MYIEMIDLPLPHTVYQRQSLSVSSLVHLQAHPIMNLIVGQSDMIFIDIIPILFSQ